MLRGTHILRCPSEKNGDKEQAGGWKGVRKGYRAGYLKSLHQGVGNLGGLLAVGLEPHLQRLWLGAETEHFSVASGNYRRKDADMAWLQQSFKIGILFLVLLGT